MMVLMHPTAPTPTYPAPHSVVMLGATGAVGQEVLQALLGLPQTVQVTTLGRRPLDIAAHDRLRQQVVDVHAPASYAPWLQGRQAAICTFGVGQPSKVSQAEFLRVDKDAVLAFALACKQAGVAHFELLGSVGADAASRSHYLRTKGELRDALVALQFKRLSIFQPSMILTPTNRYGLSQALTLALWPKLTVLLGGALRKYRGIAVGTLGAAMARNLLVPGPAVEILHWPEFMALTSTPR